MTAPAEKDLLLGQRFGREGVFVVRHRLGEGGMGTVYAAWDERRDCPCAIKFLHAEQMRSVESAERFRREGQRFRDLRHENLVRIHGLGRERGLFYIVSELIEGESLQDRLRRDGPFDVATALHFAICIARGLEALHERRVVHRDLKPANVMLASPEETVKLLDFGIAKFLDDSQSLTQDGYWVGTVGYAAPEQTRGDELDHRADLFTLGVTLYRMLAGKQPFLRHDDRATLEACRKAEHTPIEEIVPEVPRPLGDLIRRLMQARPRRRPEQTAEVTEALIAIAAGRKPPGSRAGRSFPWRG